MARLLLGRLKRLTVAAFSRALPAAAVVLLLVGCSISTPYRENGSAASGTQTVLVAVTEATLSNDRQARAAFWAEVRRIEAELPEQPGLLGYSLRQEVFGERVWTMTVWTSEADLRTFLAGASHRLGIRNGYPGTVDVRFVRISRPAGSPRLTWPEAVDALRNGRRGYE